MFVKHTLISPILTHSPTSGTLALLPSAPSIHHSFITPHSFIPGLKPPFLQILPTVAFLFFFRTDSTDSTNCLLIRLNKFEFCFFSFFLFSTILVFGYVRQIKLTYASF